MMPNVACATGDGSVLVTGFQDLVPVFIFLKDLN